MKIRIFSPIGIKPDEYRARYPELDRIPEFSNLAVKTLIFVWWFSNKTSDLVFSIVDDYERVEEALKRSGYNPGKSEKDRILKLQFDSDMALAIKRMSEFDPGARFRGYKIVQNIFKHYEELIDKGPEAFQVTEGKEEHAITYIDHKRYVDTSAKIAETIPGLLAKLEEGFGIINISGEEVVEDQLSDIRNWHQNKDTEN